MTSLKRQDVTLAGSIPLTLVYSPFIKSKKKKEACLRREIMADNDHERRGSTDDGGDICAGLSLKIWLRIRQYLSLD